MTIIFDLDDTLYDLMGSFKRTHDELFADRIDVSCEDLFWASRKYNKEAFDLWTRGLITKTEEFNYRISKSYAQYGLELNEDELESFRVKYRKYQNEIQMFDGLPELLEWLKENGVRLAILTNGNHNDQWKKIKALKLEEVFATEDIFVSEDLPAPKPFTAAYRAIEELMGLNEEIIWFVGDTFEIDITGAKNAGYGSIWFNHRAKACPEGASAADYEVKTAEELIATIKAIVRP